MQADIVLGDGMGHTRSSFCLAFLRGAKIAVNARGRNAAGWILFRHEMIAE
jgi:hypothetical protein